MQDLTVPDDIRAYSRERAPRFYQTAHLPRPAEFAPGQIWSTQPVLKLGADRRFASAVPRLVVLITAPTTRPERLARMATVPISLEIGMAAEYDLLLTDARSPLGFDMIVETWNQTPVLAAHLRHYVGRLSSEATSRLRKLYAAQARNTPPSSELAGWIGLPLMGEADPRVAFQEAEIAAAAYLADAASAAVDLPVVAPGLVRSGHRRLVFTVQPVLGKLSRVLTQPTVARAAGTGDETDTFIAQIAQGDVHFTLELLCQRRAPYAIYLQVQALSPQLEGCQGRASVHAGAATWESLQTELRVGARITVAENIHLSCEQVQTVTLEID